MDDVTSNNNIMEVKRLSLYNGTYIQPNTQVLEKSSPNMPIRESVTITQDSDSFEPMIVEEDVTVNQGPAQVGDSYDITGLDINQ